jgi:OmpA-OmpF porin, OOP family
LLSVAALVLSASAGNALRKGMSQPAAQSVDAATPSDAACAPAAAADACLQRPMRYTLEADAFALDSAELPKELKRPLDAVADVLRANAASAVRIEVHTDASGPSEARRTLTQRRAEAIKLYLIERGVDGASLHAVGMGSQVTRRGADPYAGANRRVEIVRL